MKFMFTTITAGLKVPAGLFVPNIALGAVIGRTVGLITQDLAREYMVSDFNKFLYINLKFSHFFPQIYAC